MKRALSVLNELKARGLIKDYAIEWGHCGPEVDRALFHSGPWMFLSSRRRKRQKKA